MLSLVSARTELRRAGHNSYFGLCPFHDERTPSFHVRPDEKRYHCFGCQASGDPFTFVMETEGLDFRGALEALADRFGVQLEAETEAPGAAAARARRERLHALLDRAASYYARYLAESDEAAPARAYLHGRGFHAQTLRDFRVGYAPSAGPASARRSFWPWGWRSARAAPPAASTTAFASGSCFRPPMTAAAWSASAPGRCATTSRPSISTPPTASCTTSGPSCSGSTAPARRRPGWRGSSWSRATPTCWRSTRRG